jgi:hypothetical protein
MKDSGKHSASLTRLSLWLAILLIAAGVAGCESQPTGAVQPLPTLSPVELGDLSIVTGQQVFVPAYAEIHTSANNVLPLSLTLAIHNTDSEHPIIIRSVRYYDTDGHLKRDFVGQPTQLDPLATAAFVVDAGQENGGWGANFLVEWGAQSPVHEPVIEALMVNTTTAPGVSFLSPGRVLSEQRP